MFYHNTALSGFPEYLRKQKYHVVIFHNTFLSKRADDAAFERLKSLYSEIIHWGAIKVVLPQDEFFKTDPLNRFINEFGVRYVFSVSPATEWTKIYSGVDREKVEFKEVLTGYLDKATIKRIDTIVQQKKERSIDIGYRAWQAPQWLGRHGFLKTQIADVFKEVGAENGFSCDISTRDQDTLYGDEWFRFLASCRFTIGVEGGASVLDRDGSLKLATEAYVREHPDAGFDEIEANCFPGEDGYLSLFAISPRHFEAVAARTCQVLIEGYYSGVLKPDIHYIEVKSDFSNLSDVVSKMKDDAYVDRITKQAYLDIIASNRYSYASFVEFVMTNIQSTSQGSGKSVWILVNRVLNRISWYKFFFLSLGYKVVNRYFSEGIKEKLVSLYRRA